MAALAGGPGQVVPLAPDADIVVTTDRRHIGYSRLSRHHAQRHSPYPQAAIATRSRVALVTGASDAAAALEIMEDVHAIWRDGDLCVVLRWRPGYAEMPAAKASFEEAVSVAFRRSGPSRRRSHSTFRGKALHAIAGAFRSPSIAPLCPAL